MTTIAEKAMKMANKQKSAPKAEAKPVELVGPEIPMAIHTTEATVVVYGSHLVAKREVELIASCLGPEVWEGEGSGRHGIRVIKFLENRPRRDKKPILANCEVDLGGMSLNLAEHFDQALLLCLTETSRSLWGAYVQMLLQSILHEASHISARLTEEDRAAMEKEDPKEEEKLSEAFSFVALCKLAKAVNIEPGHYSQSPYFLSRLHALEEDTSWMANQNHMLENNIFFLLEPSAGEHNGLQLTTFKSLIQLQSDDESDESWEQNTGAKSLTNTVTDVNAAPAGATGPAAGNTNTEYEPPPWDDIDSLINDPMDGQWTPGPSGGMMYSSPTNGVDPFGNAGGGNNYQPNNNSYQPNNQPPNNGSTTMVYPQTGLTPQQTGMILQGVYTKIFNHLFTQCQPMMNNDVGFAYPEGVAMPIMLTEDEKRVVVKCRCMTPQGQEQDNVPLGDGQLRGFVSSQARIPMYKIYINMNGVEEIRTIVPQNPGKRTNGQYTQPALQARGGTRIVYIMEGNEQKARATGKRYMLKIVNNQIMAA